LKFFPTCFLLLFYFKTCSKLFQTSKGGGLKQFALGFEDNTVSTILKALHPFQALYYTCWPFETGAYGMGTAGSSRVVSYHAVHITTMEDDGDDPSAFNYQCNSIITSGTTPATHPLPAIPPTTDISTTLAIYR
jgi:hypothetical protein